MEEESVVAMIEEEDDVDAEGGAKFIFSFILALACSMVEGGGGEEGFSFVRSTRGVPMENEEASIGFEDSRIF